MFSLSLTYNGILDFFNFNIPASIESKQLVYKVVRNMLVKSSDVDLNYKQNIMNSLAAHMQPPSTVLHNLKKYVEGSSLVITKDEFADLINAVSMCRCITQSNTNTSLGKLLQLYSHHLSHYLKVNDFKSLFSTVYKLEALLYFLSFAHIKAGVAFCDSLISTLENAYSRLAYIFEDSLSIIPRRHIAFIRYIKNNFLCVGTKYLNTLEPLLRLDVISRMKSYDNFNLVDLLLNSELINVLPTTTKSTLLEKCSKICNIFTYPRVTSLIETLASFEINPMEWITSIYKYMRSIGFITEEQYSLVIKEV